MSIGLKEVASARARMNEVIRGHFAALDYLEVETPIMVSAPGMEPHITPFSVSLDLSEMGRPPVDLYLHTSPEYAMKRLLAAGVHRIYQLCKVFRSEPPSHTHNPEFSMLEFYAAPGNHETVMGDLEELIARLCRAFTGSTLLAGGVSVETPFERLSVRQAFLDATGVDIALFPPPDPVPFAMALKERIGLPPVERDTWDDVFFRVFLDLVEPDLGRERAVYLVDYPAHMASLSRIREDDPRWAERFELYIGGTELANGFHELTCPVEQRARLIEEQEERRAAGAIVLPLDEDFLEAVGRMPDAGGVAVGMDRVLMLLTGAESIEDVLLFPAHRFPALREGSVDPAE